MTRKIQSFVTLAVLMSLLAGCVAPVVEHYTAFQGKSFSARTKPAKLFHGNVADLMQHGYLLIGYTDFQHNIQICYDNNSCTRVSKNDRTMDELLERAAQRGADRVQVLYSALKLVPKTLSICTGYTTTTYTDKDGHIHYMTVCAGYVYYNGYMESWTKRALLWRYAPKLASAKNNYRAVQKAVAILRPDKSKNNKANVSRRNPRKIETPLVRHQPDREDLYGVQLVTAIENANYEFLAAQLKTEKLVQWQRRHQMNLLMLALAMHHAAVSRWLIVQPVKWNQENEKGYSALEYAIAYARPADVKALLKKQPELAVRLRHREKIYRSLATAGSPAMLDYLLTKGFSVNGRVGSHSLLYLATAHGNEVLAERLLALHAKVVSEAGAEPTVLEAACGRKEYALVVALLREGARVNEADKFGNTALHYAAAYGTAGIVKLLIAHGARVNVFNKKNVSPLYAALGKRQWKTAELLMRHGVDYKPPGVKVLLGILHGMLYESPASTLDLFLKKTNLLRIRKLRRLSAAVLVACAKYCSEEKMSVLFDNGAKVHSAPRGKPLFQWAYESRNVGALEAMIRHGYRAREVGALTPLQRALVSGDVTLVKAYRLAEVQAHSPTATAGASGDYR